MENLGFLNVQKVHSFRDVECHLESLLHRQLNLLLLVEQGEDSASETELSQDQHVASLTVRASTHEVD